MGWDVGAAYIYDLNGVNDIAYNTTQFNIVAGNGDGYNTRAGGVAVYADINSGPFMVSGRWTGATQRFNVNDLPKNGVADINRIR